MYFYNETFIKCIALVFKTAVNLPANIFQWLAGTGIFYYCSNPVINRVRQANCIPNLRSLLVISVTLSVLQYYSHMVILKLAQVLKNLIDISHVVFDIFI